MYYKHVPITYSGDFFYEYWFDDTQISLDDFLKLDWIKKRKYLHREDGPAEIHHRGTSHPVIVCVWIQKGKLHRINGPAIYYKHDNGEEVPSAYFIYGRNYKKKKYDLAMKFYEKHGKKVFDEVFMEIFGSK